MPACYFLSPLWRVRDEPGTAWVIQHGMMTAGYDYLVSANNSVYDVTLDSKLHASVEG